VELNVKAAKNRLQRACAQQSTRFSKPRWQASGYHRKMDSKSFERNASDRQPHECPRTTGGDSAAQPKPMQQATLSVSKSTNTPCVSKGELHASVSNSKSHIQSKSHSQVIPGFPPETQAVPKTRIVRWSEEPDEVMGVPENLHANTALLSDTRVTVTPMPKPNVIPNNTSPISMPAPRPKASYWTGKGEKKGGGKGGKKGKDRVVSVDYWPDIPQPPWTPSLHMQQHTAAAATTLQQMPPTRTQLDMWGAVSPPSTAVQREADAANARTRAGFPDDDRWKHEP
jgi:hypothetical protein